MADGQDQRSQISPEAVEAIVTAIGTINPAVTPAAKVVAKYAGIPTLNLLILCGVGVSVWAIGWGIPAHLAEIKSGYREVSQENNEQLKAFVASHVEGVVSLEKRQDERLKMVVDQFEKIETRQDSWHRAQAERAEKQQQALEEIRREQQATTAAIRAKDGGT